jgi:hypothetical protein
MNDERQDRFERNLAYGVIVVSIILVVLCAVAVFYAFGR